VKIFATCISLTLGFLRVRIAIDVEDVDEEAGK